MRVREKHRLHTQTMVLQRAGDLRSMISRIEDHAGLFRRARIFKICIIAVRRQHTHRERTDFESDHSPIPFNTAQRMPLPYARCTSRTLRI